MSSSKKVLSRISIVTPVYNTDPIVLRECIESVQAQTYGNWELCICDDGSTNPETLKELHRHRGSDARIKIVRSPRNLHIAGASNYAAELATGSFLLFLDHDDTLSKNALSKIAEAAAADQKIDMLYSDEDKIDFDGTYCDIFLKPDWSPEHLRSVMYVLHPLVVRKELFFDLGGFRSEFSGAQDYDLALRVSLVARKIHHIPEILYHWRKVAGSASAEVDAKPYALDAGQLALQDFLNKEGEGGQAEPGALPGFFRTRYPVSKDMPVSLLFLSADTKREIPGKGVISLLRNAIESIAEKSTHRTYEIVVIHNDDLSQDTLRLIREVGGKAISAQDRESFNYSRRLNFGFSQVSNEQVISLNDDIEVITPDWIESLLEWSMRDEVGAVGARLLYPDRTVQHSGVALDRDLGATHLFYKLPVDQPGYYGFTHLVRNYSAVTGAVFATRRSVYSEVGGFDPLFSVDFNDVDFCLRLQMHGYRIVCTPFCELYHHEGSSLKRTSQNIREAELFRSRWHGEISRDPYFDYQGVKRMAPFALARDVA